MPFTRSHRIALRQTDAAGVLFFAEQLALVHDVYQELLREGGLSIRAILDEGVFALPIVKAETELLSPLRVDDEVEVALSLEREGETSFTLAHSLTREGAVAGRGRTVHVCVDGSAGRPRPLPDAVKAVLAGL